MSKRGGAKGAARGGGGSKGKGGGRRYSATNRFTQQFSGLAVDGSSLSMDREVPIPNRPPMPGNKLDSKAFQTILKGLQAPGFRVAEFPLRKAFATASTTVYTNHFAIELDPSMPLYEYKINGLPEKMGNRSKRILVQTMIDNTPFLTAHRDRFVTNCKETLISWIKLDDEALAPAIVRDATESREGLQIGLTSYGVVNTRLLIEYAEGKIVPTAVSSLVPEVQRHNNLTRSSRTSKRKSD
jgi:eukaryotic translation initiation factor 2C